MYGPRLAVKLWQLTSLQSTAEPTLNTDPFTTTRLSTSMTLTRPSITGASATATNMSAASQGLDKLLVLCAGFVLLLLSS
jgi:hypothetical protein